MKAGEYVGKDGRTYTINGITAKTEAYMMDPWHEATGDITMFPTHPDWPAAKAALDALVEAEAETVFSLRDGYRGRVTSHGVEIQYGGDGGTGQFFRSHYHDEINEGLEELLGDIYRAGRSVALEDVKELVGLIDHENELTHMFDGRSILIWIDRWDAITKAAKKVTQ